MTALETIAVDLGFITEMQLILRRLPMWAAYLFALGLVFRAWYFHHRRREAILVGVPIGALLIRRTLVMLLTTDISDVSDPMYLVLSVVLDIFAITTIFVAAVGDRPDPIDWRERRAKFGMRSGLLLIVYFALAAGFARALLGQEAIEWYCMRVLRQFDSIAVWSMVLIAAIMRYPKHRITSRFLIAAALLALASIALAPFGPLWQTRSALGWYGLARWITFIRLKFMSPLEIAFLSAAAFSERPPKTGTMRVAPE